MKEADDGYFWNAKKYFYDVCIDERQDKEWEKELCQIINVWCQIVKRRCRFADVLENKVWKYCPEKLKIKDRQYIRDWRLPSEFYKL